MLIIGAKVRNTQHLEDGITICQTIELFFPTCFFEKNVTENVKIGLLFKVETDKLLFNLLHFISGGFFSLWGTLMKLFSNSARIAKI